MTQNLYVLGRGERSEGLCVLGVFCSPKGAQKAAVEYLNRIGLMKVKPKWEYDPGEGRWTWWIDSPDYFEISRHEAQP